MTEQGEQSEPPPCPCPTCGGLAAEPAGDPADMSIVIGFDAVRRQMVAHVGGRRRYRSAADSSLRDALERDLGAIHAQLPPDWTGKPQELPPPPPELTDTYAIAFGSAARRCEHRRSSSTTFATGGRQCDDCGRYFRRRMPWEEG